LHVTLLPNSHPASDLVCGESGDGIIIEVKRTDFRRGSNLHEIAGSQMQSLRGERSILRGQLFGRVGTAGFDAETTGDLVASKRDS